MLRILLKKNGKNSFIAAKSHPVCPHFPPWPPGFLARKGLFRPFPTLGCPVDRVYSTASLGLLRKAAFIRSRHQHFKGQKRLLASQPRSSLSSERACHRKFYCGERTEVDKALPIANLWRDGVRGRLERKAANDGTKTLEKIKIYRKKRRKLKW